MVYNDLDQEVAARFPELAAALAREREDWAPDVVGGDIVLADYFVPFFLRAVEDLPAASAQVAAGSAFIEELSTSDDDLLRAAARISVLQALEDYPEQPWKSTLGPASRAMLPTRGHEG